MKDGVDERNYDGYGAITDVVKNFYELFICFT